MQMWVQLTGEVEMKIETGSESEGKVNTPNKRKRVENQVEVECRFSNGFVT